MRQIISSGHFEYTRDTLAEEYVRDQKAGIDPQLPVNYFPDDDLKKKPKLTWSIAASTFFSNWINYAVYQEPPYDLADLRQFSDHCQKLATGMDKPMPDYPENH